MKKVLFALIALASMSVYAQKENPRGLYKLQTISNEDGTTVKPPFEQYKFYSDYVGLTFALDDDSFDKGGQTSFTLQDLDGGLVSYTGKVPMEAEGKKIQIYDSDQKKFTMRWFNDRLPNNSLFPYNQFSYEYYSSQKGISKNVVKAFDMLKMNIGKKNKTNPFHGVWRRRFYTSTNNIYEEANYTGEMYKIYSNDAVMIMSGSEENLSATSIYCQLWPFEALSKTAIQELNNTCLISWINDDCFSLVYTRSDNHAVECEMWDRCGLPENFQKTFGTNVPIRKIEGKTKNPLLGEWVTSNGSSIVFHEDSTMTIKVIEGNDTCVYNDRCFMRRSNLYSTNVTTTFYGFVGCAKYSLFALFAGIETPKKKLLHYTILGGDLLAISLRDNDALSLNLRRKKDVSE